MSTEGMQHLSSYLFTSDLHLLILMTFCHHSVSCESIRKLVFCIISKNSHTGKLWGLITQWVEHKPFKNMHKELTHTTHTHTHTRRTLFKEVCFFYYFLSHSAASPLFQSALVVQWKSHAYYVLRVLQNQLCFVQISLSPSLFNIHGKRLGSHKMAVFPVFFPTNSQVRAPMSVNMEKGGTSPDKHLQGCATLPRVIHSLPGTEAKLLTQTCERPEPTGLPAAAHARSCWNPHHIHICLSQKVAKNDSVKSNWRLSLNTVLYNVVLFFIYNLSQ